MLNIEKPTLIINKDIVLRNIKTSKELSKKLSISFRPHNLINITVDFIPTLYIQVSHFML